MVGKLTGHATFQRHIAGDRELINIPFPDPTNTRPLTFPAQPTYLLRSISGFGGAVVGPSCFHLSKASKQAGGF